LNLLKCSIQGRFPGTTKPDVWKWLGLLEVAVDIDKISFRVQVLKTPGEERSAEAKACLARLQGPKWVNLYEGAAGEGLEEALSDLFMEELGFAKFYAYHQASDAVHTHGWPAMSSALFISDPGSAIFGDITVDGLPLRLLQMFSGLPWVSTLTAAKTAKKRLESLRQKTSDETQQREQQARERINTLASEIVGLRARLSSLPDRVALRRAIADADATLARTQEGLSAARIRLGRLEDDLESSLTVLADARRTLQAIKDERSAGYVFRRLRPVCCPACEVTIDRKSYEGKETACCALCGNTALPQSDEDDIRISNFEADVADADKVVHNIKTQIAATTVDVQHAELLRDTLSSELQKMTAELTSEDQTQQLETEIASKEARIDEIRRSHSLSNESDPNVNEVDLGVLTAAEKVTKRALDMVQERVLADLSEAVKRYAKEFGIENLESVDIKGNGAMNIVQGGTPMTFTKLSAGERLRMRIAAALSVIEVARAQGYGRHPGLLVLDSPGSQEMSPEDFGALVQRVQSAVETADGIQILVGALARAELERHILPSHRIHAKGDGFLF
jgi:hypothetical protein